MLASSIPPKFNIPFGNSAGAGFIRSIPQASQIGITAGAASLVDGFPPVTFDPVGAGGVPPFGQDFNGLFNQVTKWSQWASAGGPVPFDATFSAALGTPGYPKGALVASATTFGVWWLSTVDNNVTDPDAAGAGWVRASPLNLYGVDAGATNAYVVAFAPVLVANVIGLPLKIKILNGNTGASTLNAGPGAAAIVRRNGSALIGGELVSGRITTLVWNGTAYEWEGTAPAPAAVAAGGTDTQSAITPAAFLAGLAKTIANPGSLLLPGGLIIKWGTTGSVGSPATITFGTSFPGAAFVGLATINGNPGTTSSTVGTSVTTTAITISFFPSPSSYHWIALGN